MQNPKMVLWCCLVLMVLGGRSGRLISQNMILWHCFMSSESHQTGVGALSTDAAVANNLIVRCADGGWEKKEVANNLILGSSDEQMLE